MKRMGGLLLTAILLVSCDNNKVSLTQDSPDTTDESPELDGGRMLPLGTTATFDSGGKVTVFTYEQPYKSTKEFETPQDGKEFGIADVEICGDSEDKVSSNGEWFTLKFADNTTESPFISFPKDPALKASDLSDGECLRGYVSFEPPIGKRPVELIFDIFGTSKASWKTT